MTTQQPHIRAIDGASDNPDTAHSESEVPDSREWEADYPVDDFADEYIAVRRNWIVPAIAVAAALAWTGFFAWTNRETMLAGAAPAQWIAWITSWATPVLLIVALWLLALRTSTREAARFGDVANVLSVESARLESHLVTINRELSLAREFLTTQSRELEFLGRGASERISEHADRLQGLIRDNGQQVDAIADVSTRALENMAKMRDNLPVIANSTRDVANQIGAAGHTAQAQLAELVGGFQRLNEFGSASERQVVSLRGRVDQALEAFAAQAEQLQAIADARFVALREESETFRSDLDGREVEVLAAIRGRAETLRGEVATIAAAIREGEDHAFAAWNRQVDAMDDRLRTVIADIQAIDEKALGSAQDKLAALHDEAAAVDTRLGERNRLFHQQIAERSAQFGEQEDGALARLHERLARLDEVVAERRTAQLAQMEEMAAQGDVLGERIATLGDRFATVAGQGNEARTALADGIDALNAKLVEGREALDGTDMAVAALTDASVRLLELIQASAKHSRDDLPVAMEASENRLAVIEARADEVRALLDQARQSGDAVVASMSGADAHSRQAMEALEGFQARFGETAMAQVESVERLGARVAALSGETDTLASRVQGELRTAIAALEAASRDALSALESEQTQRVTQLADTIGERSAQAIDRAIAEHSAESVGKLEAATLASSEAARESLRQLREQLGKVNELTGNLETRVARAREAAQEQTGNDFTRRAALITESLNSNAIDIAKALSTEVTDTAWASYLRGDRGVFTRRAVKLLDNGEAREIAAIYDADYDFREHVNRYIHDFEAMLRVMLSTRDGNALSVTLLSSDMGKLYVALAQAIQRLRQ